MRRRLLAVLGAALLASTMGCSGGSSGAATSSSSTLDATFSDFDGVAASFVDYRGTPVVVNFFASTCIPCQTEMPAFEAVHRDLGDAVRFVGINVGDTVAAGRSFVEAVKVTWAIGRDPDAAIAAEVGSTGLPTTVLLDRSGHIVFRHLGALSVDELRSQLRAHQLIS